MSSFLRSYTHITEDERQNPLQYLFFIITFCYGFAFLFFTGSDPVTATVIYQLSTATFGAIALKVWGFFGLFATIGSMVGIVVRKTWLGNSVSMAGFLIWLYSAILYASGGFWLQAIVLGVVQMLFWAWWYLLVNGYHRRFK